MKKIFATVAFTFLALPNAFAAPYAEHDASALVKRYSETVACQLEDVANYQKNQYKAVKIVNGDLSSDGLGDVFLVYWEGDVGCAGGNGTIVPNFTVVEHAGFASTKPIVQLSYKLPEMEMVSLTSMTFQSGVVTLKGVTYGPNDQQHQPKKVVTYRLKFDPSNGFTKL